MTYSGASLFPDFTGEEATTIGASQLRTLTGDELNSYSFILVLKSGGKDGMACLATLLEAGADAHRIELWHHLVDGNEGSTLMDWPCTTDYVQKLAQSFDLPLYFSWREGGIEREMNRDKEATAPVIFQTPDGREVRVGGTGPTGTRLRFPQQAASLSVRWCSSSAKIDVGARAITNQERFNGKRTLFVTGERAEESSARAQYAMFEPHRTSNRKRHVDHYRPVLHWTEAEVWDAMRRHGVVPHPAYRIGWPRVSCRNCLFLSKDHWATMRALDPAGFGQLRAYEEQFESTLRRDGTLDAAADKGRVLDHDPELARMAMSAEYTAKIRVAPEEWVMPSGPFLGTHGGAP